MEPNETNRASVAGYLIVLVGAAGWVVGCFLPLYGVQELGDRTITLYGQISFGSIWTDIGGALYLFGGISAIFVISILGVLRMMRTGTRFLLVGAVVAWSFVSIGVLISLAASFGGFNTDVTLEVGYWCCWASVIVVIVGTVVVLTAERRQDAETGGMAPPLEVR
jgi:hypothetical protein